MLNSHDFKKINTLKETDFETYCIIEKMEQSFLKIASRTCHDIRNSVALIDSYCQLMSERHPELSGDPMWNKVIKNTRSQISQLNDISAFRYSYVVSPKEAFSTSELIEELRQQFPDTLQIKTTNLPDTIYGMRSTITYSVTALITNALEACSSDIQLNISAEDNILHFTVTDNGCGFADSYDGEPWEPFVSSKKAHTGLGLSTSYNTAIRHGGSLIIKHPSKPTIVDFSIRL